jgi:integrase
MTVDYGMIQSNPCQRVRKFRLNNRRERYLSVEEEGRLMNVLLGRRAHLRPIVILALNAVMRRGEILNLEWCQVDFITNRLIVTKTKSRKPRHIPIKGKRRAISALERYAENFGQNLVKTKKSRSNDLL